MPTKLFLYTILLLFSLQEIQAQGSWEVMDVPTTQHLRSVYFTDSLYGWAVGDTGTIIQTQDGGESWIVQDAGTYNNVVNVFFLDRQRGWASSWNYNGFYGTLILKTTDGGNSWHASPYPDDFIFIHSILYLDTLTGWMGGSPHALVKTMDGGQSWTQAAIDTNALAFFPILNVYFYDENYGYACGGMFDIAGVIWSTSNGGDLWYPIDNSDAPADEIHGLHMFDSINVMGAGGDPDLGYGVAMIRTENGGMNWNYEELSMSGNAFDLDFRNETEAWAPLGPGQKLIYSMDAGTSWTEMNTPENTAIFDMTFPDSMHGYGVGYDGAFIKYIPQGLGIMESLGDVFEFGLYPNPAEGFVRVSWEGESLRGGDLVIVDLFGKQVSEFPIQSLPATIDLSGISAGMYICTLKINKDGKEYLSHQKLILR